PGSRGPLGSTRANAGDRKPAGAPCPRASRRADGIPEARSRTAYWCLAGWSRSTLRKCVVDREPPRPCQCERDGRGHEGEHEFVASRQEESGRQVHEEQSSEHRASENDAYGTCEEP